VEWRHARRRHTHTNSVLPRSLSYAD
jgi:hypothetical protein